MSKISPITSSFRHTQSSFARHFPITSRMFTPHEIIVGAAATRLGVGLIRVWLNRPGQPYKAELTKEQRYASFLERIFVELFGSAIHVASMFLLQEPIAKLLENPRVTKYLKLPSQTWLKRVAGIRKDIQNVSQKELNAITKALEEAYPVKGTIAKQLYVEDRILHGRVTQVQESVAKTLGVSLKKLPNRLKSLIRLASSNYHRRLWHGAAATLLGGILGGAFVSGYIIQWLNDYFISPKAIPWFNETLLGLRSKPPSSRVFIPREQRTFRM